MHAPMTIAAMRAGANVFVEKPVAATTQDVRRIKRVSQETGKFVAVGYQYIYQPDMQLIKKMLLRGDLGKLKTLKCHGVCCRNSSYYTRNNWAGKLRVQGVWVLDSPYNNALAHYLMLIGFFAGKEFSIPAHVATIQSELYRANDIENSDTACMRIKTDNDVELYFYATHACPKVHTPVIVIIGEKGRITFDVGKTEIIICMNDGTTTALPRTPDSESRAHVLNALRCRLADPDGFICDMNVASLQTFCCNGAHESSGIHDIPDNFKFRVKESEHVTHIEIVDIENIIAKAFDQEKLFSELDIPWALPGLPFRMAGYQNFNGGSCTL
jgi:predicted dehydrogenase